MAYSDYSGTYHLDSKLNASTFGLKIYIKAHENEYFDIGIDFKGGICDFTNDVSETITILNVNNTENSTSNFTYFNLGFGGGANLYYSIFRLGLNLGFLTEFENATNVSWIDTMSSLILCISYIFH